MKGDWVRGGRCPHFLDCNVNSSDVCWFTHRLFRSNTEFKLDKDMSFYEERIKVLSKKQRGELGSGAFRVLHLSSDGNHARLLTDEFVKCGVVSHVLHHNEVNMKFGCDMNLSLSPSFFSRKHNVVSVLKNFFNGNWKNILRYDAFIVHNHFFLDSGYRDLKILRGLGKKVLVDWNGQDVRMWDMHKHPNLKGFRQTCTTPDLQEYGDIEWIPYGVNLQKFRPKEFFNDVPRIVHPTNNRLVKGTDVIQRVVKGLRRDGYKFDFVLNDNLSYADTLRNYLRSDIVIDWINRDYDIHGAVSVENMALGNVCVASCGITKKYTPDCPVVDADEQNLREKLIYLLDNPSERKDLGKKGVEFVKRWYDIKKSAKKYLEKI